MNNFIIHTNSDLKEPKDSGRGELCGADNCDGLGDGWNYRNGEADSFGTGTGYGHGYGNDVGFGNGYFYDDINYLNQ